MKSAEKKTFRVNKANKAIAPGHQKITSDFQKIQAENLALAKELEQRNYEAKVEASLERVRSIAMSMNKPEDMLQVCQTISLQLELLGLKQIRNVQTAIFYEARGTYMNYEYYARHQKTFVTETVYTNHKIAKAFASKMLKGKGQFYTTHIKGKKVKEWLTYQKTTNVFIDKFLEKANSLSYYWHSLGPVALGISTYTALSEAETKLFIRFLNVFELAYRRFLDIEKAFAQAYEARIEASLERVRAQAMSIRKSEELADVGKIIFTKLKSLGFGSIRNTEMVINNDEKETVTSYHYSDYGHEEIIEINYKTNPLVKKWADDLRKADDAFVHVSIAEKQMKYWNTYRKELGYKSDPKMAKAKTVHYYSYSIGLGALSVSTWQTLSEDGVKVLERFRNVFHLSYQRYIDIAQAEAQAREAQIELALERVRARTMAMQRSEELSETVFVLHQQFRELGEDPIQMTIGIYHEAQREIEFHVTDWAGGGKRIDTTFNLSIDEPTVLKKAYKGWKEQKKSIVVDLKGKELQGWLKYRNANTGVKISSKDTSGRRVISIAFFSEGHISISGPEPLPSETIQLLERFAGVFDLTHRRFQDLKNAEAQTRQAQIEVAIEKVRARSLAMQKPEELIEVAEVLRKEMGALGVEELETSSIYIVNENGTTECWYAIKDIRGKNKKLVTDHMTIQLNDTWVGKQMQKFYRSKEKQTSILMQGYNRKEWINYCADRSSVLQGYYGGEIPERTYHLLKFSNGYMGAASPGAISAESWDLLQRATAVFSFAYTRFSDLQHAEAQAREAQIELALERVRARTMAMQHSHEFSETAHMLFDQFRQLGEVPERFYIGIMDEEKRRIDSWGTEHGGSQLNLNFSASIDEPHVMNKIYSAWKKKDKSLSIDLSGKLLKEYFDYLQTIGLTVPKNLLKGHRVQNIAFFSKGFIGFITNEPQMKETFALLERFAGVFDLTYTRFSDLQKAEAQAREAQIELALERVRARTMAMQKSDELKEIIQAVYDQFVHLNVPVEHTGFILDYKTRDDMYIWLADQRAIPSQATIPYFDSPHWNSFVEAKEKGMNFFVNQLTFEEKNKFYHDLFELFPVPEEAKEYYFNCPGLAISTVLLENVGLYIENFSGTPYTDEQNATLMRFGKVFQQAYTRFLDLQKAEAQAREAQIEAALERVRSRSLAMHKSEEMNFVREELLQRIKELNIDFDAAIIILFKKNSFDFWAGYETGKVSLTSFPSYDINVSYFKDLFHAKNTGQELFAHQYMPEEKNKFFNYLFQNTTISLIPKERKQYLLNASCYTVSVGFGKQIAIQLQSYSRAEFSESENDMLKRFVKIFEQAYTRFLDLQKAEAQAREARINLGVERVRAKALAMHASEEIMDVVAKLKEELMALEIPGVIAATIFLQHGVDQVRMWDLSSIEILDEGYQLPLDIIFKLKKEDPDLYINRVWENNTDYFVVLQDEKGFKRLLEFFRLNGKKDGADEIETFIKETQLKLLHHATKRLNNGKLVVDLLDPPANEIESILTKMGEAFDLAYTRFLDLQKAEAQAREAQIEASLERVRAKTMAMHNSEDVSNAIATLFTELDRQSIENVRCGIAIIDINKTMDVWSVTNVENGKMVKAAGTLDMNAHTLWQLMYDDWKNKNEFLYYHLSGKEKQAYIDVLNSAPGYLSQPLLELPDMHCQVYYFNEGAIWAYSFQPHTEHQRQVMHRFTNVFSQTFLRYRDLQKAEAQAREAQIEAALERVRSKTMAMHKSHEIIEVVKVMDRMNELNIEMSVGVALATFVEDSPDIIFWYVDPKHVDEPLTMRLPYFDHVMLNDIVAARQMGKELLPAVYSFEEKNSYFNYAFENSDFRNMPDELKKWLLEQPYFGYSVALQKHSAIFFDDTTGKLFSEKENDVLVRFSRVFEQAYIRFLDLQKAEAQAREAQIEAALERVRSRTMAMHNSIDVSDATAVMFNELSKLGVESMRCGIAILHDNSDTMEVWAASVAAEGHEVKGMGQVGINGHPLWQQMYRDWKLKKENFLYHLQGEDRIAYYRVLMGEQRYNASYLSAEQPDHYCYITYFSDGNIFAFNQTEYSAEQKQILNRFANVFSLTYRRYLDLKNAEAQAREAQIEAALERVRSRSIGMQKSEELRDVINLIYKQLLHLGINVDAAVFDMNYKESDDMVWWGAVPGQPYPIKLFMPYIDHPVFNRYKEARDLGQDFYVDSFTKEEKNSFFQHLFENNPVVGEERKKYILSGSGYSWSWVFMKTIALSIFNYEAIRFSESDNSTLMRFAKVFEQCYTRFLDLQNAEMQAREATIEAALEKVRGKAMAMHNSSDLIVTAGVLFAEMRKLGINSFRCGVGLLTKENRKVKLYSAAITEQTDNLPVVGWALLEGHEVLTEMYERWLRREDYFPVLKGDLLKTYYVKINSTFTVPIEQTEQYEQNGYFLPFSEGLFYGWSEKPYTEGEIKTLHRFKAIVDLTFRRYIELQKSEEVAREAVRQASLDRVRAEIASMRTKNDLDRITPLIWNELTILDIPFVRCGVFIFDEKEELIHTFLSTPYGKAIAAFHVPYYDTPLAGSIEFWRDKKIYRTHWGVKEYADFADSFIGKREPEKRAHYLSSVPKEGIHLHLLPFMQGMLYVGNVTPLQDDSLSLIQSVADAFSTAYARYEDFNKLEAAKQQVEKTLVDLKQTQAQLVQSEKMASLGELTAGIAHEIQNPLNFVNNFSEVNTELIDELEQEVNKGNFEEVKLLAKDIKDNEQKINHHGKRAGDIVKGMLQHSRSSSGVKEPTDINALADEYLRLAYHGLRTKDKSFNAKFETVFDKSIGKIDVIPQDMGRVILNLITNAFYAVNERMKRQTSNEKNEPSHVSPLKSDFEPTVIVSTKNLVDKIEIRVKDNGNGIPQKILDKIFQPFFTTKPTGQGTGLGLSLSYDIVKAHCGEIKVETREGEGSEFIIHLPIG